MTGRDLHLHICHFLLGYSGGFFFRRRKVVKLFLEKARLVLCFPRLAFQGSLLSFSRLS